MTYCYNFLIVLAQNVLLLPLMQARLQERKPAMSHKHASHNSAYLMAYTSPRGMLNNSFTATFQSCQTETEGGTGYVFVLFFKQNNG